MNLPLDKPIKRWEPPEHIVRRHGTSMHVSGPTYSSATEFTASILIEREDCYEEIDQWRVMRHLPAVGDFVKCGWGIAPVKMRILGRDCVLVCGPPIGDERPAYLSEHVQSELP